MRKQANSSTGSIPLNYEVVYNKAVNAEYWVNLGQYTSLDKLLADDAKYKDFAAFKNGMVYNNNARVNKDGGNDYWQSGVTHPEILLSDLVTIFHPDLMPNQTLVYYQKLQ